MKIGNHLFSLLVVSFLCLGSLDGSSLLDRCSYLSLKTMYMQIKGQQSSADKSGGMYGLSAGISSPLLQEGLYWGIDSSYFLGSLKGYNAVDDYVHSDPSEFRFDTRIGHSFGIRYKDWGTITPFTGLSYLMLQDDFSEPTNSKLTTYHFAWMLGLETEARFHRDYWLGVRVQAGPMLQARWRWEDHPGFDTKFRRLGRGWVYMAEGWIEKKANWWFLDSYYALNPFWVRYEYHPCRDDGIMFMGTATESYGLEFRWICEW